MTGVYEDHLRNYKEWCRVFCNDEQLVHLAEPDMGRDAYPRAGPLPRGTAPGAA